MHINKQFLPQFLLYSPLFFILQLLLAPQAFTQQKESPLSENRYDSLSRVLKGQSGDTAAFTLLRLADYQARLSNGSDSLSLPLAREAYHIFKKTGNGFGMAWAKFEAGSAYMNMGKLDSALKMLLIAEAIPINDSVPRKYELLGTIADQISGVYDRQGNFEKSIDISLKEALPLFEKAKNETKIAGIYSGIASTFLNLKQYDKAVYYYHKELSESKIAKTGSWFATDFSRLGFCLTKLGKRVQARPYFDSALQILNGSPLSYPWLKYHYFKGYLEKESGHYPQAIKEYDAALAISQKTNDPSSRVSVLYAKYDLLYEQKKYARANAIANNIEALNMALDDTIALDRLSLYKTLWESEKSVGHYQSSLNWLEKYAQLADSAGKREQLVKISDLLEKYQTAKKEKQILQLETESRQQQLTLHANKLTTLLLVAALIIMLLLLLGIFLYAFNRRKRSRQKEIMYQQQLLQRESEQQLLLAAAMLEGEENERTRLAHELHDGLGGTLFGIKLKLQGLTDSLQEKKEPLGKLTELLAEASAELRRIAHNLMPENLQRFGLEAALQDLCHTWQTPQTAIHFYSRDLYPGLPKQQQLVIYRIIQELLANGLKHAYASEIFVTCIQQEDQMDITVEDNGVGVDLENTQQTEGMGLKNIRNRTKYLRGSLAIESKEGLGTTIQIHVHVTIGTQKWNPDFEPINHSQWKQN